MIESPRIAAFWKWFASACNAFGNQFENARAVKELDRRIARLGSLSWEIGPGLKNPRNNLLVISPGGDKDLLPLTRAIVLQAPKCKGWEFYPAKPPKHWKLKAELEDPKEGKVPIDATDWRYALRGYPDGTFDIVVRAPELVRYDDELQHAAAALILDGELGEEARLNHIVGIEVVSELLEELGKNSNPITVLKRQWTTLTGS